MADLDDIMRALERIEARQETHDSDVAKALSALTHQNGSVATKLDGIAATLTEIKGAFLKAILYLVLAVIGSSMGTKALELIAR